MPEPLALSAYGVTLICAVLFLHPYLTYPLTLRLLPARPLHPDDTQEPTGPRFSLLFCAYNEIAIMAVKLENLRALKAAWPDLEILAYDDASDDGTWESLTAEPDLLTAVRGDGRTGKAHGMKVLAARATGEYLVCTDANVVVDPGALGAFAETYRDPSVGGICGTLHYTAETGSSTEAVGGLYWRLEEVVKDLESRTGNVMGADGSIFSVRRVLYPAFPDTVQDDFTVSMSAVLAGRRLVRRHDALATEALVSSSSEEFRRKIRIAARAYHTHLHLRPGVRRLGRLDRYKYVSHKMLRWHGATFLALGAVALAVGLVGQLGRTGLSVVLVAAGVAFVVLGGVRRGPVGQVREILLALVATNLGVWQAISGRTYQTWQPPPR